MLLPLPFLVRLGLTDVVLDPGRLAELQLQVHDGIITKEKSLFT